MLRFLLALSMSLGLGLSTAQAQSSPAELLAFAVAESRMCEHSSGKIAAGKKDEPELEPLKKEEKDVSEKFSLKLIFRAGRYQLSTGENVYMPDGRQAQVIKFTPWPKEQQLRPAQGEDKDYARIMNQLTGEVFIDPATGGIMKIKAELSENIPYYRTWLDIKFFDLQQIEATFDQRFNGQRWVPSQVRATVKFWRLTGLFMNVHDRYLARFHCN